MLTESRRIIETKDPKTGEEVKKEILNTHVRRVRELSMFETEMIADKILVSLPQARPSPDS